MNRRDLLKGLTALPLGYALKTLSPALAVTGCPPTHLKFVQVMLSGPFAVVLQTDGSGNVTNVIAFAPMADNGEHFFSVNGSNPDNSKVLKLALPADGLILSGGKISFIDPGFSDFSVHETLNNIKFDNPFVRVDLPCPDEIIFSDRPATGHFKSSSPFSLPLNHVLLYRVDHGPNQDQDPIIKMTSDLLGDICLDKASDAFVIEVGQRKGTPGATAHAVKFFNEKLLPRLPDVKGKELNDISLASGKPKKTPTQKTPAKKTGISPVHALTLECKHGGLIVTTP
jgi:hypothetical protein